MVQAAVLAVVLFVVYAVGASRTIYVGDSGELVTAVHLLGIPHPSGYPLYVLLGKLWTVLVPVGSVAFRMSLFSAACAALTCALLHLLGRRMSLGTVPSLLGALLLAFSPSFWSQANIQRVYSLNALFVVGAMFLAWRWWQRRDTFSLVLAFLVCGLGASNHLFMAVHAACLGVFVLFTEPGLLRRPVRLMAAALAFVVGLLPYLYLPLRSRANPRLDWGDPETLQAFLAVLFRRDFWDRRWYESPMDLLVVTLDYLRSLGAELAWVGLGLALLGLAAGWRRHRLVLLAALVMMANLASMALHGSRVDLFVWHRYYIPSFAMAALLAAVGTEYLLPRLPRRAWLFLWALPALLAVHGWERTDRSHYSVAEDFSTSLLRSLPPGAHLVATDDNVLFSLMYLHLVQQMRPDVNLILQGVGRARLPPLHFDPDTDAVFFTHDPNWQQPGLALQPVGQVFRAVRTGRPMRQPVGLLQEFPGEEDPRVPKDFLTQNLIGQFHYMLGMTYETSDWPRARREFKRAARAAPQNDVLFYNLGLIYRRNGRLHEALGAFRRSHAINPRHLASHGRPKAADRIRELEQQTGSRRPADGIESPGSSP